MLICGHRFPQSAQTSRAWALVDVVAVVAVDVVALVAVATHQEAATVEATSHVEEAILRTKAD